MLPEIYGLCQAAKRLYSFVRFFIMRLSVPCSGLLRRMERTGVQMPRGLAREASLIYDSRIEINLI